MTDLDVGSQVGDYVLEARLGGGSFGSVWRARHASSEQVIAIKLLTGRLANSDRPRIRAEVELLAATASSKSPHVVRVLEGGLDPVPYVVMEYIEGTDLASLLRERGTLPLDETVRVGLAVADALRALEQAGIIHRDVKPANVMLDRRGTVKLADFGIAKIVGYDSTSVTGQVPMTMAYAAPEVWEGYASHQSDLYALGILLYQCLTGSPPFVGNYGELYRKHTSVPPNMEALPPETPQSLREAIALCLEKEAGARPRDAAACTKLLHQAEAEIPTAPVVVTEPVRFGPWLRREPHARQPWAWRCLHETTREDATVEVHFAADLGYGAQLRKAVAANSRLVPLGAERLLGTNRLLLRPGEGWQEPPEGEFCFWVARDELPPVAAPAVVTVAMLEQAVRGILALIDASDAAGLALSLAGDRVALRADGSVRVRRPGLPPKADYPAVLQALAFLEGLPLDREAAGLVAVAPDIKDLRARLDAVTTHAPAVPQGQLGVARPAEGIDLLTHPETEKTETLVAPMEIPIPLESQPVLPEEPEAEAAVPGDTSLPEAESLPRESGVPPRRRWPRLAALAGGAAGLAAIGFVIAALWPGPSNPCGLRAPTNVTAKAVVTSVLLNWHDNSDGEDGFRIEVRDGGNGEYRKAAEVGANVTSYVSGSQSPGTYGYRVRAYNAKCESNAAEAPELAIGASPTRTPTPSPPQASQIAYAVEYGEITELAHEIRVADVETGQTRLLAKNVLSLFDLDWSPDGQQIAFCTPGASGFLWVIDGDASDSKYFGGRCGNPAWSPDGTRIAFGAPEHMAVSDVFLINSDGTSETNLTNRMQDYNTEPAWSSDGKRIVFAKQLLEEGLQGTPDLYLMNTDGSGLVRLTDDALRESSAHWSPDGKEIVYQAAPADLTAGAPGVYVVDIETKQVRKLQHSAALPRWSPDGSTIAYVYVPDGDGAPAELHVLAKSGTDDVRIAGPLGGLSGNACAGGCYDWSPDGSQLAFVLDQEGKSDLFVVNADGTGLHQVTNDGVKKYSIAWGPAGAPKSLAGEPLDLTPSGLEGETATPTLTPTSTPTPTLAPTPTSTPAPAPTFTAIPAPNENDDVILFSSNRESPHDPPADSRLYVLNRDGTGLRRFTGQTDMVERYPDWSPGGDMVVFATGPCCVPHDIAVADADGSNVRTLLSMQFPHDVRYPTWSPDGSKIAFLSSASVNSPPLNLYVVDSVGGEPTLLSTNAGWQHRPSWSPDSSRLAFNLWDGGIGVIGVDGSGFTGVTNDGNGFNPAWSPTDGDVLAYLCAGPEGQQQVCTYTFSTGDIRVLATISSEHGGIMEDGPSWSPDGSKLAAIAVLSREPDVSRLYLIDPETGTADIVADIEAFQVPPVFIEPQFGHRQVWSRDGQMIAVAVVRYGSDPSDENVEVFTIDTQSGSVANVTNDPSSDQDPHWRP
jgi:Tol biopolymer transport system component/predicted Ser/Thr protein kinase